MKTVQEKLDELEIQLNDAIVNGLPIKGIMSQVYLIGVRAQAHQADSLAIIATAIKSWVES